MHLRIIPDVVEESQIKMMSGDETVADAASAMTKGGFGAIVIGTPEKLEGIFTERDALTRVLAKKLDPKDTKLVDVMTSDVTTLSPDSSAMEALVLMQKNHFRHLPVVKDNRLVSIVSIRDLYRSVMAQLEEEVEARDQLMFGQSYGG